MSYLGMVNFYRRFIKGVAGVLKPLKDTLRGASGKAAKLEWSTSMLVACESSKKQMVQVTHLAHPGKMATLALSVDASNTHIGAALQQEMCGSLQPLGFFSRKLNTAEQKYSAFDKRVASIVCCNQAFPVGSRGEAVLRAVRPHAPHLHPAQAV